MSKSLVEKYEQMLAQDPSSTAFVELARAYLERGDNDGAMAVCEQGLGHHPGSVVGRVLWGKALINVGRAAEAMGQFDKAVAIDKDNPHAYNLIGEVLLRKGLFRSALPVLRKAAALQPNDGRVQQWLEQTRAALSGGPAPVLYDATSVDMSAMPQDVGAAPEPPTSVFEAPAPAPARSAPQKQPAAAPRKRAAPAPAPAPELPEAPLLEATLADDAPEPAASGGDPDVFAAFAGASLDGPAEATVLMQAYTGTPVQTPAVEPPTQASEMPQGWGQPPPPPAPTGEMPTVALDGDARPTAEIPASQALEAPDPFAQVISRTDSTDTFRGLTSTFDALAEEHAGLELPRPAAQAPRPSLTPSPDQPTVIPAPDLVGPEGDGGLLDDIQSMQSEMPSAEMNAYFPPDSLPPPRPSAGGLLDDIPDHDAFEAPSVPHAVQKPEFSTQATEAIAKEYEKELRQKFEATTKKKSFLQRNGVTLAVALGALVVLGGLGGSFLYTRSRNAGETLDSAIGKGLGSLSLDTREGYDSAIQSLTLALSMDDASPRAHAYRGFAHAVLFAEHGGREEDRAAAVAAYGRPKVRDEFPEYGLVVDLLVASKTEAAAARQQLMSSGLEKSEVYGELGRIQLADGKAEDARKSLTQAVELNARNIRALVALADYYRRAGDFENALKWYGGPAEQLSKAHPARVIGMAEARLELGVETAEALSDMESLTTNGSVPDSLKGRYTVVMGRALSANGRHDDAVATLQRGLADHKDLTFEFQMALGEAGMAAGRMDAAQAAFEEALKLNDFEGAKEGLGRVLLARSREKELLARLKPDAKDRKVALLRGIAYVNLGDARRARQELNLTQLNGKVPAEAAVYLALADASEEQVDKAVAALETLLTRIKKNRATVQIALARLYMKRGTLDKARGLLEEAAKDPHDYEGNALLGELLLSAGVPMEIAIEPLTRAVERNGSHAASRHQLTRAYVAQGRFADAAKQVDAWVVDNPALDLAWKDATLVYFLTGRLDDAEKASVKALKGGASDVEALRLRAQVLFARGDTRGAFASLEKGNRVDPKDAETFCEIGHAFVRQGNNDTALKAYEAAVREDSKSLCGRVGPLHAKPSSRNRASATLKKLLAEATDARDKGFILATLARVHLEERKLTDAAQAAEEATQLLPNSAAAWFARGEVAEKQRDGAGADSAYEKAAQLDASWAAVHMAHAQRLEKKGGEALPLAIKEYDVAAALSLNEGEANKARKQAAALRKQAQ